MLKYARSALVAFGMATAAAPALADSDKSPYPPPPAPNEHAYVPVSVKGWNKTDCVTKYIREAFENDPRMKNASLSAGADINYETGKGNVIVELITAEDTYKNVGNELVEPFQLRFDMKLEKEAGNTNQDFKRWSIMRTDFLIRDQVKAKGRNTPATLSLTYSRYSHLGNLSEEENNTELPPGVDGNGAYTIIAKQVRLKDKIHECVMHVN